MKRIVTLASLVIIWSVMTIAQSPQRHVRVLFIGDSITDGGWGRSGGSMASSEERNQKDLNHIYGHGYMEMTAAHFLSTRPSEDYQFFNRGISGNTLADLHARWEKDALALHPDIVSILVGTNDADCFLRENGQKTFDQKQWKEEYRKLIEELRKQNPQVKIVIGTPFVAKAGRIGKQDNYAQRADLIVRMGEAVKELAIEENAICIPYGEMFAWLQKNSPRPDYWIWDGIHPTTAGHRRMADLWIEKAGTLFKDSL